MGYLIVLFFLASLFTSCNQEVTLSSRSLGGDPTSTAVYPVVDSISPSSYGVKGGTTVTISGSKFEDSATVTVGGSTCTNPVVTASATITCTLPAHFASVADVVVTNGNSYSGTLIEGFAYNSFLFASNQSGSPALTRMQINSRDGGISVLGTTSAPSGAYGVEVDPTNAWVYTAAVNANSIAGFTIDHASGGLTAIAGSPFTAGTGVDGLAVSKDGKCLIASNWNGGGSAKVTSFAVNSSTGALSKVADYAGGNNPSLVAVDPQSRFAFVANYTSNSVSAYTMNTANCTLALVGSVTGVGSPDGIAVHPNGLFVYAGNATASGGVTALSINQSTGALTLINTYTTSDARNGSGVEVDKTGSHLYVTSRGNGVVNQGKVWGYNVNSTTGELTVINNYATHTGPNDVRILGDGRYVFTCNTEGNSINIYSRSLSTGVLSPASPASVDISGSGGLSPGVIGITF